MANGTDNYLILELKSGYLRLRIQFRHMTTSEYVINNGVKISDNVWHQVSFSRNKHFGILTVDNVNSAHDRRSGLSGVDEITIDDMIYVGGFPRTNDTVDTISSSRNFSGCLRDLVFNGITVLQNLFGQFPYGVSAGVNQGCVTTAPYIASHLQSQSSRLIINISPSGLFDYLFDFWFRTTDSGRSRELVYIQATYSAVISLTSGIATMLQVGTTDTHVFQPRLNDGSWHQFRMISSSTSFRVYIDNDFGSVAFERTLTTQQSPQITIGSQNAQGFIGCIRDLKVNGISRSVLDTSFARNNIIYNSCSIQNFCQPFFPCYNNATCVSNPGSFACICGSNSNYEGTYCQLYKYRRNCQEIFTFNPSATTGVYTIDPDGPLGSIAPFRTRCSDTQQTVTEIAHDRETLTVLPSSRQSVGPGRYSYNLIYKEGTGQQFGNVSIKQAAALADISESCSQNIVYRCQKSVLLNTPNTPYGWWVSRNNMKMVSWGGAPADSRKCACGVTGSCANRTKMCNCDGNFGNTVLTDSGSLNDKRYLPVKQVRFGFESLNSSRIGIYSVGKLICRGNAAPNHIITFTTRASRIELPDWQNSFKGVIDIAFKSTVANGTLLKNVGRTGDFFELSVQSSAVQMQYNLGQGIDNATLTVNSAANTRYNDDQWHRVRLFFSPSRVSLRVDSLPEVFRTFQQSHQVARLDIDGPLFVGYNPQRPSNGFIGCIGSLYISESLQHLDSFAAAFQGVKNGCGKACFFLPCQHNTPCTGNYSSFRCDCTNTDWTGERCEAPKGAHFSGNNVIEYKASNILPRLPNGREDISFTFVTNSSNCRIFHVQTRSGQQMEFGLVNGEGYVSVGNMRVTLRGILSDTKLHKVIISPTDDTISIDGVTSLVRSNVGLSVLNLPIVVLGSSNNDNSVSMCINDISFVGIRIMNLAFSIPRNNSVTFIRNSQGRDPISGVCTSSISYWTGTPTPSIRSLSPTRILATLPSVGAQANVTPGGIVGIIIFLLIVLGIIIALYVRKSKQDAGKYTTEEAKAAEHQATVEFKAIGPEVDTINGKKELYV
ncbi:uncharacterized protein TRIADDRAFT_60571 [Trichoplax adhaerens]|uniref:Uncharacterized protein n=1 Tax=Trichoplax adhaerens TaxID=10228 RepID=B3S8K5_TRIAD|nr:hypothetical protein TRIADDRAFT_60571 [Trichoplax adhaerens]EDV20971.1 hypothetical protein TRIADDRAFT_60571 [Trichoplax adhaerens]|eukprot:XP_002116615.1 hypothetical protein TRIADDRAFT_60571 [Trichoplax adhaerens]